MPKQPRDRCPHCQYGAFKHSMRRRGQDWFKIIWFPDRKVQPTKARQCRRCGHVWFEEEDNAWIFQRYAK